MQVSAQALTPLIQEIIERHGTLTKKIDLKIGTLTPRLSISSLSLRGARNCQGCVRVDAELDGSLRWVTPIASGREALSASLSFDAVAEAVEDEGVWSVQIAPRNLRDVAVDVAGQKLSYAEAPVRAWIDRDLLRAIPPQTIATLGDAGLPLRAVRVDAIGSTLQLSLLSRSPHPIGVSIAEGVLDTGWQLTISPDTLTDLAAAAAFENGVVGYAVVPVPLGFSLEPDQAFTLDLRLWKISGRGWWRDYRITGTASLRGKGIRLEPSSVEEAGQSPGADWVDPIAMIGEGVILNTLEKALTTTLPTRHRSQIGGVQTTAKILDIKPHSSAILVVGDLVIPATEDPKEPPKKGRR